MTEAEAIEALTGITENCATYGALWLSATFAYLTAAHFLGAALSRFQCAVVSSLYAIYALQSGAVSVGQIDAFFKLRDRTPSVYDEIWIYNNILAYVPGAVIFYVGGVILSLYFMYNVRSKAKAARP